MQGLPSGNFSFQIRAVDAAGNAGTASYNYIFTVDSTLRSPGEPGPKFWGLGWKFWLIVGAGSAVLLAAILALSLIHI